MTVMMLAGMLGRLTVCHCNFNLSQQINYLFWLVFLSSSHTLTLFQCLFFTGSKFAGHSIDIGAERVSTESLVVVKEFTLNRCPFQ